MQDTLLPFPFTGKIENYWKFDKYFDGHLLLLSKVCLKNLGQLICLLCIRVRCWYFSSLNQFGSYHEIISFALIFSCKAPSNDGNVRFDFCLFHHVANKDIHQQQNCTEILRKYYEFIFQSNIETNTSHEHYFVHFHLISRF